MESTTGEVRRRWLLGPVRSGVWSNSVGNAQREVRGWGGPGDLFFAFSFLSFSFF